MDIRGNTSAPSGEKVFATSIVSTSIILPPKAVTLAMGGGRRLRVIR
jgi:hypothetical protein